MMKLYSEVRTPTADENEDKCDYGIGEPCLICGKTIKKGSPRKMLRLVCGGKYITDCEGAFPDDMGWYPVGSSCYRNFVKVPQ